MGVVARGVRRGVPGLPELGFMVENRILQLALWQQFAQCANLTLLCPAGCNRCSGRTMPAADAGRRRDAAGAHGCRRRRRQLAGAQAGGDRHQRLAVSSGVHVDHRRYRRAAAGCDRQRFFPSGPRAFLPLYDSWASLVWYDSPQRIRQLQAMPPAQLEREIAAAFPARLGPVKVHAAGSFPLTRRHAQRYVLPGLALLGMRRIPSIRWRGRASIWGIATWMPC